MNSYVNEDISQQVDPATATINVTAVEIPELTEEEQRDRLHLERKVERAFFEAGKALMELRDRKLYRSTHKTFEDYCRDRFGYSRRQPYHLIEAANDFSCTVKMWDGEYTVGLQHLKSYNYLLAECEQMQLISDRISWVYSDSLEETVKSLLQSLGKLNRPYLTAVEEKLLNVVELEYGSEITQIY